MPDAHTAGSKQLLEHVAWYARLGHHRCDDAADAQKDGGDNNRATSFEEHEVGQVIEEFRSCVDVVLPAAARALELTRASAVVGLPAIEVDDRSTP